MNSFDDEAAIMNTRPEIPSRRAWTWFLGAASVTVVLAGSVACGGGSDPAPPVGPRPPVASTSAVRSPVTYPATGSRTPDASPSVSGRVVMKGTTRPVPGTIVEFKPVYGKPFWTTVDSSGRYSLRLPADVYTAVATIEPPDTPISFRVAGGRSNAVTIEGPTRVDFEATRM